MALVLMRRPNEGITITVPPSKEETEIHIQTRPKIGVQVRYAISAPKGVSIVRDELIVRTNREGNAS